MTNLARYLDGAMSVATIAYMVRVGVERRRDTWLRHDWLRGAAWLALPCGVLVIALAMAAGVDHGVYHGMAPTQHAVYFWTMVGLGLLGTVGIGAMLGWFAFGRDAHGRARTTGVLHRRSRGDVPD